MRGFRLIAGVAGFVLAYAVAGPAAPAQTAPAPDFSSDAATGWISFGPQYIPIPGRLHPVDADPAHPFIPNAIEILSGQPNAKVSENSTFPVSDTNNPILQPWARERLAYWNDRVLSGHPFYSEHSNCWPMGVPAFLLYPVAPVHFIQSAKEVIIVWQGDHMVRHVYLNAPHSTGAKPSWYGDSIGHYEGDALVVDTIGLTPRSYIDEFRTPHTEQLHVIERFHMVDGGRTMQVDLHVEDPGTFTTPWDAIQRYRRVSQGPLQEQTCSENNVNYFNEPYDAMPEANRPDF